MFKNIKKITVVGGGTAGCVSALILKTRFPQKEIQIIESPNVGIIGVGESTTEHWSTFCSFVGIDQLSSILECNATFKIGIYFKDWSDNDFLHSIDPRYNTTDASYYYKYAYIISSEQPPLNMHTPKSVSNQVSLTNFNHLNDSPTNQYHFDTYALNKFLHNECKKRNINIIVDELTGAKSHPENGNIVSVFSDKNDYESDFFIDCTGFSKFLIGKHYNIPWVSYSDYFPLNSAIAFPTKEMEEYNKYTLATRRNAGWSWSIPVQGRTGNGYVYCDSYINDEEAIKEMEDAYNLNLDNIKTFKFVPGRLEKSWYKNCYAVGLSQSFVEPLEATSIGSIIQQMFCFIHYFPSYDIASCNKSVIKIFDNIADFVQSHYLIKNEYNDFWKDIKYNLKLTPNLSEYISSWKKRLPLDIDVNCPWGLFKAVNYIPILYGLDWFNKEKIKEEFLNYIKEGNFINEIQNGINEENYYENNLIWVGHKQTINLIKSKL